MASLTSQLRVLQLNKGECLDATLFRLEKGWRLHFVLGPSLAGENVRIFTNHPQDSASGSNRQLFRELPWQNLTGRKSDVYDNFVEVSMVLCGSFNYFFTIDGSDVRENANGSGYFLVDPLLRFGRYDERLPLDSVCCQTVITKSLGLFPEWKERLQVAKESGYNMIHFTPVQELGLSNSAYALKDQLRLSPAYSPPGQEYTLHDLNSLVKFMEDEWDVLSLTDLVYNHTANESLWIQAHPECAYNMVNSPHLKPAYLLDRILWHFSLDVAAGNWIDCGIPAEVNSEEHLRAIRSVLFDKVLARHKIPEYYLVHIDETVQQFRAALLSGRHGDDTAGNELFIIPDPKYRRLKSVIPMALAINIFYSKQPSWISVDDKINSSCNALRNELEELNRKQYETIQGHLNAAVDNFIANVRWRFVDAGGPRIKRISEKDPLMYNYFTLPSKKMTVEQEEATMHSPDGAYCMAHNGWVMNDDPLRNFAEPGSNIYLRRELIPWGDSVKLRYGKSPNDCPFLWEHMKQYTVETARIFHGVRLDNCHSTPIHVAEYMLDEARKVRPDLYVIAELFTSSEYKDNIFINRLGLSSLIREGLSAWNCHELGRLVHRYGGHPVGSFIQPPERPLVACVAHAMFMDQTHDNPSPVEKRSAYDLLPSAALVAVACCASGSNRGYDELVPHHINVVTEPRLYQSWTTETGILPSGYVNNQTGIIAAKRALNQLHQHLGSTGYNQVYVDQVTPDIVSVTRHNPVSHKSIIVISRTAFSRPHCMDTGQVPPLKIAGVLEDIILEAHVIQEGAATYQKDESFINGLPEYSLRMMENIKVTDSGMTKLIKTHDGHALEFIKFPPGSVIAVRISLDPDIKEAVLSVRQCLSVFGYRMHTYSGRNLEEMTTTSLETIAASISLNDINRVLYHSDPEERDDGLGISAYNIPGYGCPPYCGLQGLMSVLNRVRASDDLGHPLCKNLRDGDWLCQYIVRRLKYFPATEKLGSWFDAVFQDLTRMPRYLIPCYFDAIIAGVYAIVEEVAWAKMNEFVRNGSTFVRALGLGSVQFCSVVRTARLPTLSPNLPAPKPATICYDQGKLEQACVTISAGFPHFASGIFRCWGRDTFIALRGLLLIPGRYDDARFIILAFAGCLRHGLIPNLLGAGTHARYNCRDAIWWWLQCIQDYCTVVPDGHGILNDPVSRLYPTDDSEPIHAGICDQPLHAVIQEALQKHANGLRYRERNAGSAIDNDMSHEGFNVSIGVDWETGFVYGGSSHNCGTWMDKMGSSDKAKNRGVPATPRDGSAVELVGLCASATRWLSQLSERKLYPYTGVSIDKKGAHRDISFDVWHKLIVDNFEKYFWIDTSPDSSEVRRDLINRRGIYKDSHKASQPWTDYQLRPNVPIAMVVAPELFTPDRAWTALETTEKHLLGPLGMKTLDPSDWNYNGNYINSDDSADPRRAKGFNYHQGPEWVWPMGFFLRAKLYFAKELECSRPGIVEETVTFIKSRLSNHNVHIQASEWKSLPELTNDKGSVCHDSCPAQAWSVSCVLEVLYDMETKHRI